MTNSYKGQLCRQRRDLLRASGAALAGYLTLSTIGTDRTRGQESQATLTFNDQESDGESVVIASASTTIDARLLIVTGRSQVFRELQLGAGTEWTDRTVELTMPMQKTQTVRAELRTVDGADELLAGDRALVAVGESLPETRFINADPDAGFNYPYYLYIPSEIRGGEVPLLVEPNNTGTSSDDFEKHRMSAEDLVNRGPPRRIADSLNVPLLVPVFPRPESEPVNWRHYTHQLDRQTLQLDDGPLERIDLQLLGMVDHAREQELTDIDRTFREEIMLNGFSASGNFSDRFTVLQPDRVLSVTAGGLNGMALLPTKEQKGQTLNYHVGIADVESLIGESVNVDAVDEVNQFLYMGAQDENDTLPYDDAWTNDDLLETARMVYGEDMIEDRFPTCQTVYEETGIAAQFRIYEGIGHRYPQAADIIEFHRRSIEGEDVDGFGTDLSDGASGPVVTEQPQPTFTVDSAEITAGESITFDASPTKIGDSAITSYSWAFKDGSSATGKTVTHKYTQPGTYSVELTVEDVRFSQVATQVINVAPSPTPTPTRTSSPELSTPTPDSGIESPEPSTPTSDSGAETARETSTLDGEGTATVGDSGPGFGVGGTLASLGAGAYLLVRRLRESSDQ